MFIAFIAPFASTILTSLKRALRKKRQGTAAAILYKASPLDYIHSITVTGIFLLMYLMLLVYKQDEITVVLNKIGSLSVEAQRELYDWLKADLIAA